VFDGSVSVSVRCPEAIAALLAVSVRRPFNREDGDDFNGEDLLKRLSSRARLSNIWLARRRSNRKAKQWLGQVMGFRQLTFPGVNVIFDGRFLLGER
jgi:hypothetical protein